VPAIFPDEFNTLIEKVGFELEELSQLHIIMSL